MAEASANREATRVDRELPGGPPNLSAGIALIRDDSREPLGVVAVLRDITEAKSLQQRLRDFVSMVAHELRAPLGAIGTYLDVVRTGSLDAEPEKQSEILGRCHQRTEALAELVNDLLEFSRLRRGREDQRTVVPLDLVKVLEETVEFAARHAAEKQVSVTTDVPSELPLVDADRGEITRLFTNLVDNAIKYNRNGGSVRIAAASRGANVFVEVADTGIGVPQDQLARLGETFFRVKTAETENITGTGLGVSICKQIVDAHNGQLEIESAEGEGSTFRVLLPMRDHAVAAE
jgi:two-component system phosphate regulon sensor histidine kinase PhoR